MSLVVVVVPGRADIMKGYEDDGGFREVGALKRLSRCLPV